MLKYLCDVMFPAHKTAVFDHDLYKFTNSKDISGKDPNSKLMERPGK